LKGRALENNKPKGRKEELDRIDEILSHVRSMDAQMGWLIRSGGEELKELLLEFFSSRKRAAKVYLAVDGERTSGKIAEYLGLHVQAVSYEISELENKGLIELKKWGIYRKSKIDTIIRLSLELRKKPEFSDIK
jgi:DNA-binding transcriptional ArsR family regulator